MKITFITGHLCKERHALLYELAIDLGKHGANVTVITGFPSRRITSDVRQYYINHPVEVISENVIVKRVGSKKGEGKGLFSRMVKYFFLTKKLLKEAMKVETDVYYLYSSPFFLGYIGKKLSKRSPTIYNAQDLFPDTLIHTKKYSENNLLIKYFRMKERQVYRHNTHIITISTEMKKNILSHGGIEQNVSVIYNWADTNVLHHVNRENNVLFDEFGINRNKFIISYAGDLGLFQGWDTIIESAKLIYKYNMDIEFVLIGNGSYRDEITKLVERENLKNIKLYPMQPYSRISEVYSFGDVELLPIEKGLTKMALPSKSGVIMSVGSPIIAIVDEGSDIYETILKNEIGLSVTPGDSSAIANAIMFCFNNRDKLRIWGQNARHYACLNLDRNQQTKKYFDCICNIIEAKKD